MYRLGTVTDGDTTGDAFPMQAPIQRDLYVSLSGTLGTLYIFYDLSRHLTLRGQTGSTSAVDLIHTLRYD